MAYAAITKPSLHFNTVTFTGNNGTNAITGVGFQPDMVWTKRRNGTTNHLLYDAVRGAGYYLFPNLTNAQGGNGTSALDSFDSDGFTLDSGDDANTSGATGVGWSWKAANSSGSSNSDGSITSTVSANTTAGFSIVTYTGTGSAASFGHGLSTPDIVLIKDRTDAGNEWYFHTTAIDGSQDYLRLQSDATKSDASSGYSIGASVFNLGGGGTWVNVSSKNYVAYCFKSIKGYSKFGSYNGNSNADGTFVYTGFKPAFVIFKSTSVSNSHWYMWDNKRDLDNPRNKRLYPNLNNSEGDGSDNNLDFLSNGFKMRSNNGDSNQSGQVYFYMAFAAEPLVANVGANGIPATAG